MQTITLNLPESEDITITLGGGKPQLPTVTLADKDDPIRDPCGRQYPFNVGPLTWTALPGWLAEYSSPIEEVALNPRPPMVVHTDPETSVATLMFDARDTGHPLTVRNATTGQSYTRMCVMDENGSLGEEQFLKFYSGNALLVS